MMMMVFCFGGVALYSLLSDGASDESDKTSGGIHPDNGRMMGSRHWTEPPHTTGARGFHSPYAVLEELMEQKEKYIRENLRMIWTKPFFRYVASKFIYVVETRPNITYDSNILSINQSISLKCKPAFLSKLFLRSG